MPVVVHHGDSGWRAATCFEALFAPSAPAALLASTPHFSFTVDDLTGQDEDGLRRRPNSALTRLTLLSLRSLRRTADLQRWLDALRDLFEEVLAEHDGERAFGLILRYDFEVRGKDDHATLGRFAAALNQERNMQTIAQMLEERGLERGLQQGRQEGLRGLRAVLTRQLRRRFGELPAHVVAQIEAADQARLEQWADRVLDTASLDDVLH